MQSRSELTSVGGLASSDTDKNCSIEDLSMFQCFNFEKSSSVMTQRVHQPS